MKIEIPNNCPCCDYALVTVNEQLFCKNTACPAQLSGKVIHFAKTLGIKGLGPATVAKLQIEALHELYFLDPADIEEAVGSKKMADKLFDEINLSRSASLDKVIAAFSIPLIGATLAAKVCSVISNIDEINNETCKQAGLGEKATNNLITWLTTEFAETREFLPFEFSVRNTPASKTTGPTVCITGKLTSFKTKSEATAALTAKGYQVVDSVTKATMYLLDEGDKGSTKRKKAEDLGIPIISNIETLLKETI